MGYILIFILFLIFYKFVFQNKLRIDFKSFFCKGFKKFDNAFGLFAYTGKQGKERHILRLSLP